MAVVEEEGGDASGGCRSTRRSRHLNTVELGPRPGRCNSVESPDTLWLLTGGRTSGRPLGVSAGPAAMFFARHSLNDEECIDEERKSCQTRPAMLMPTDSSFDASSASEED